jgi:hypothetical protein
MNTQSQRVTGKATMFTTQPRGATTNTASAWSILRRRFWESTTTPLLNLIKPITFALTIISSQENNIKKSVQLNSEPSLSKTQSLTAVRYSPRTTSRP